MRGHREMAPHAPFVFGCGGARTDGACALPALLVCHRRVRVRAGARAADRRAAAHARAAGHCAGGAHTHATPPSGEQPGSTGGQLPRTGWDALLYFALGAALLLGGARLRVITRIREVVQRVRRRSTEAALREALEPIRAARLAPSEPDPDAGPLHVEPSTPTARRLTGVGTDSER